MAYKRLYRHLRLPCFRTPRGCLYTGALTRVPDVAWFTIVLAAILSTIFILWLYGKETQWKVEGQDRYPTSHFLVSDADGKSHLIEAFGG